MISVIHPSRGRAEKSANTIAKWKYNAVLRFELIVSVDADDDYVDYSQFHHLPVYGQHLPGQDRLLIRQNKSSVEAINAAAQFTTGDILIVVSDDTDCPPRWDETILKAVEGKTDFLLRVSDGHQKRICTLPIMDRTYYNRFGYIYYPEYSHNWCDTELTEVAYKLGRIIVRNDIVFRHLHPEVTKEPKDAVYLKNDLTHNTGRNIFNYRKSINFGL